MNNNYWKGFFQSNPEPYLILKAEIAKYTILEVNDAFVSQLLFPLESVKGKSIFDIYPIIPGGENVSDIGNLNVSLEKCISGKQPTHAVVHSYRISNDKATLKKICWNVYNFPIILKDNEVRYIIHKPVEKKEISAIAANNSTVDIKFQNALLQARTEATPDGVLVVDGKGRIITYNKKFAEIWRIPEEILDLKDDNLALEHAMTRLVNPQEFISRVKYLYQHPDNKSYDRYYFKDGRIAESYGIPIKGEDGTYYGWAWYLRDITERVKQLLAVEKVRQKVARDLHDDVGSTLTTIGLLSEIAKVKLNNNIEEARDLIQKISENSHHMMESLSDIVWSINPVNDSMDKILVRMREYAVTLFEAKKIEFEFTAERSAEEANLNMEARLDFFLIFKETINNLVKYSQCSFAEIMIQFKGDVLFMSIRDNGIGFDLNNHRKGNGLVNLYKRAKLINAKLEIDSKIDHGTKVMVEVHTVTQII